MSIPIPRIRGKTIQKGSYWTWEIFVSIGDCEEGIEIKAGKHLQFINKESAMKNMKKEAQNIADLITRQVYKCEPNGYMDLLTNTIVKEL